MFAVIKTGGKQYRVVPGDVLTVEKLTGVNGDHFDFTEVLMVSDGKANHIGAPLVEGAVVKARILNQERADKIIVFKKKRRHNYRRKNGHRQYVTAIQVLEIAAKGMSAKAEKLVAPKSADQAASQKAAKPAQKKAPAAKAEAKAKPAAQDTKVAEKKVAAPKAEKKPAADKPKKAPAAKKPEAEK